MIPKNLNVNQLLLMMLFTATLFDPLVNADGKTFMISNDNRSAKAVVGTDKKIEVKVALNSKDYEKDRKFFLTIGGCKLSVVARINSLGNGANFEFSDGTTSKSVDNPKSFEIIGQELIFEELGGYKRNVKCNQGINFVSMDGKLILDVSLAGDVPQNLVLTSNNLVYNGSDESDGKVILYVCIGVGVLLLLLLVIGGVVIFIYIKRRKQKAAAAKKSKEQLKTAVSAEKTKVSTAKELSEQKPSKEQVKVTKLVRATPRDQKTWFSDLKKRVDAIKLKEDQSNAPLVAAEEEDPMEAKPQVVEEIPKPAMESNPQLEFMPKPLLEAKPQIVEEKPMPAMEAKPQVEVGSKPSLEMQQPQLESMPKPVMEANPQVVENMPKPAMETQQPQLESMPKPVMETQPPQVEEKPKPSLEMQPSQVEEGPKSSLETQSQVQTEPNPRRIRKKRSKSSKRSCSHKSSKRRKRSRKAPRWRLRKSQHELQKEEARKNEKLKEEAESNSEMKRPWEENDGLKTAEDDESAANQRAKEQDEK